MKNNKKQLLYINTCDEWTVILLLWAAFSPYFKQKSLLHIAEGPLYILRNGKAYCADGISTIFTLTVVEGAAEATPLIPLICTKTV